ncbi:Type II secretion system protein E [Rubripirellula lacrimiformis]|uniref:Type II secretion system protein E n=1 Tax=Rubripirellula lacrimiformis TaxID=1930273 RepID=A0A517NJV8_9BACT|nr:ATPase, T2SS/T4P/T4SS family [Rubripirellula lacrimiformis]QDT07415.1 Type II secretion system protein E [Rubripirellula lacrimiformis]
MSSQAKHTGANSSEGKQQVALTASDCEIESNQDWQPLVDFVERFPIEYCRRHQAIAAVNSKNQVRLLYSGEQVSLIADNVGRILRQPLLRQAVDADFLRQLINNAYEAKASESPSRSTDAVSLDELFDNSNAASRDDLLETDTQGPVVQLVNSLLLDAIQQRASDVHLQPFENSMVVRMRIDGVLTEVREIPKSIQDEVVSRLKVAGQMNIAEKRLPQDGRATVCVGDRVIDLRLASMPTSYGERVVVRLLDKSARLYSLAEIGMDAATLGRFNDVIHAEHGLVLVTGPTGSGKSTTLYGALTQLDTSTRNAVTLEDPIEYQLDGISQTQINTKKGMTFASGLRSVLRQDPDIIMLGEIRDEETAVMAVQSALTGHLVFSTLHTNDAASAVTRMLDLGIEPYLVSSSLLAVLAQRLVRRVCTECRGVAELAVHCRNCRGTGYRGREGIYELLVLDDSIRDLIQQRAHASQIREAAIARGMKLLRESGAEKVQSGITTLEEIERVTMRTAL